MPGAASELPGRSTSVRLLAHWLWGALVVVGSLPVARPTMAGPTVSQPPTASGAPSGEGEQEGTDARPRRIDDPFRAYEEGLYDQALARFVDLQVERPEDPALALNIGSAHYKMRDWEQAAKAYSQAAMATDPPVREQALYNLGNVAYRQGRLGEAVELYKAALELVPDDADAKVNLEFVRDEIRRRQEEARKQKEQQKGQGQQQEQPSQQQGEDGSQQGEDASQRGEQSEPQSQGGGEQGEPSRADQDRDGLPDEVERGGTNPTDPANPDTDRDGLADGREDANRSGGLDPGETDPNRADSDGDGVQDGAEAEAGQAPAAAGGEPATAPMSAEEAERFLQALEEGRPLLKRPGQPGRPVRPAKDW